jgi:E1A-binding protein p400
LEKPILLTASDDKPSSTSLLSLIGSKKPSSSQLSNDKQSIAERAKHEAQILQRISQLRKEGLWSIKRLPKLVEPAHPKTHWDFLLDEMTWMSTDFQQERRWKKNCSRKLSVAILKYFKDKELRVEMAEKEEAKRLRKQANLVAREIMQFWKNVEKIAQYKQKSIMEEKRKQAMDSHLNFIVDQTEKYSSWLMESLNPVASTTTMSSKSSTTSSSKLKELYDDDDEFNVNEEEDEMEQDDESTIDKEERLLDPNGESVSEEIKRLQMECELPLDDLLKDYNLDENYFSTYYSANRPVAKSSTVKSRSDRLLKRQMNREGGGGVDSKDESNAAACSSQTMDVDGSGAAVSPGGEIKKSDEKSSQQSLVIYTFLLDGKPTYVEYIFI